MGDERCIARAGRTSPQEKPDRDRENPDGPDIGAALKSLMVVFRRLAAILLQVALLALVLPPKGMPAECSGDHHDRAPETATQCDHMVACAAVAVTADPTVVADDAEQAICDDFAAPRVLVSVTRAPDPPPPRA